MSAEIIFNYFPDLTEKQKNQFDELDSLYKEWNEKINVISRKDIDELYVRHVLHSLSIARFIHFLPKTKILDIGTGGGFPGIPLAIFFPKVNFHLVDSIQKKIKVVNQVAKSIGLQNLSAEHQRAEKVSGTYDFIISRAVAKTKQLYSWGNKKIKKESSHPIRNGFILLKGGDLQEELQEYGNEYVEIAITDFFKEDFFATKKIIHLPRI